MYVNQFGDMKRIHFIGIGGIGMSGIAQVLFHNGYSVSGSDVASNNITTNLVDIGIHVYFEHSEANIASVDVVVVSSAIGPNNIELISAHEKNIPVLSRAEMLAELMRFKFGIAVSGTHGKTTTTSLIAHIFKVADLDPTYVIGGVVNSTAKNADLGKSEYLITEADESDASFIALNPMIAVVTNIDNDHMETYADSSELQDRSFLDFIHKTPFYGNAVVCGDDPRIKLILNDISRKFFTYGMESQNDLQAYNVEHYGLVTKFSVKRKKLPPLHITLNMPGRHNILNSLAAIAVATICKIPDVNICNALRSFSGIGRRFQIIGNYAHDYKHFAVIDDYGHHPTELEATIETARTVYNNSKITMVFQPHRYSRTKELWAGFVSALAKVDNLLLLDIYPGSESPIDGITSGNLVSDIQNKCKGTVIYTTEEDLCENLLDNVEDNGVVLFQGAGSVSKICRILVASLQNETAEL